MDVSSHSPVELNWDIEFLFPTKKKPLWSVKYNTVAKDLEEPQMWYFLEGLYQYSAEFSKLIQRTTYFPHNAFQRFTSKITNYISYYYCKYM